MGEFDEYNETKDVSNDTSEQDSWARTWDMTSFEEDTGTIDDSEEGSDIELIKHYEDVENQYKAAKNDIEISKSEKERSYWTKRADELWEQRDDLDFQIRQHRNNKDK